MKKITKMHFVLCVLLVLCMAACKKSQTLTLDDTTTPTSPVTTPTDPTKPTGPTAPNNPPTNPTNTSYVDLGTGSGTLSIDGKTLKLSSNSVIRIKAGNYRTIYIKNITGVVGKPVLIQNNGQVNISVSMETENLNNVSISGDNDKSIQYGISFNNIAYRAVMLNGKMNGVTLKNISFKNVDDYCISGNNANGSGLKYTGSADTRTEGLKILNCLFDNAGAITFGGNLNHDTGEDSGLFKDVEIAYNIFQNNPSVGTVSGFTNVQDYNIHHNVVNNINQNNNNHNGVFQMQGNGKFHDNKLTNYQGNSIRMWLYSRGSTPATNEIYNNICYNTRKYGGFELQAFDRNIYPGKSTFANAKVYNNTVGHMNTSKDWEGQVLDLYNTGGSLEYYNNLGFELNGLKKITNMINNMSDTKIIKETGNKYLAAQSDAVSNLTSFTTKFAGVGATGF